MTALFTHLPTELVVYVLSNLDTCSLLTCRTVCTAFRDLIDSTPNLQYAIELLIAGQEDGGHYQLCIRREMLKQHQQRWANLQWTKEQRIQMFHGGLWELYGNLLAQNTSDKSTVHFWQLPSQTRGIEEKNWTVDIKEFRVRDFGIDPGQDLLVILEEPLRQQNDHRYRVHFRALSTGQPHRLASGTQPLTHEEQRGNHSSYSIQTCGDVVGILIESHNSRETEVVLWNWKTGQLLANIVSDEDITAMVFLSERYIMLGVLHGELGSIQPRLVAIDFIAEPAERRKLEDTEKTFIFCLPALAETADAFRVDVRTDPAATWQPDSKLPVPFFTSPNHRLYVITLLIATERNFVRTVQLCALGNTFLSLIERFTGQNTAYFNWRTWGPEGTRMTVLQFVPSQTWVCYVYGTRYVSARRKHRTDYVYIYDFNQQALRWNSVNEEGDAANTDMNIAVESTVDGWKAITAPTITANEEIFEDRIETKLGFRVRSWAIPGPSRQRSMMCSEDGIVIVNDKGPRAEYQILTI
ncbi:hypothetical protein M378DRAFT_155391 [Amanita muscaria Koide BX008]|uniref:F-box domain-containing protein n=1 Tax=Amanita muscaria (strain Koide BX008) TaxID=946122 RepID=A0A0C2XBJ4_AMAMK|nr:hypothetical protein M378DRAFT_155391 [Amanita muscaria Koide BX008]